MEFARRSNGYVAPLTPSRAKSKLWSKVSHEEAREALIKQGCNKKAVDAMLGNKRSQKSAPKQKPKAEVDTATEAEYGSQALPAEDTDDMDAEMEALLKK